MSDAPPSDEVHSQLIRDVAEGNARAERSFRQLFDAFERRTYGYFLGQRLSADDAEELTQLVFIKLARVADQFRGESRFSTWFHRLRTNVLLDWIKSRDRRGAHEVALGALALGADNDEGDDAAPDLDHLAAAPACDVDRTQVDDCVTQGLQQLERDAPRHAQVIRLTHENDYSTAELAALIDRTEGATRQFLSEARKKARQYMTRCLDLLRQLEEA